MRVLIVSTAEKTGGAAVAANRLVEALNNSGVKAKMLVRDKTTEDITTVQLPHRWLAQWRFLWERWCVFCHLHFSKNHLFDIDIANAGADITSLPEFKEADVIHLHWINQGMLSLASIRKIVKSGKAVVVTMHDMWYFTGICHYSRNCHGYIQQCGNCPLLPGGGHEGDLSAKLWRRKRYTLQNSSITFVACSSWLAGEAKQSRMLQGQKIESIPNAIDTHVFCRRNKQDARLRLGLPQDKKLILFVSQRTTNVLKGMHYLVKAIDLMVKQHPDCVNNTAMVIMGGQAEAYEQQFAMPVFALGYLNDTRKIVDAYNAADLFVLPSLQDNLPNVIMEAMACGVPCAGFNVGGIPEEIDHLQNGYVAACKDAADLAHGIWWTLFEANYDQLSANAERKVIIHYSQHAVALKYTEVYNQAMALKNYHL